LRIFKNFHKFLKFSKKFAFLSEQSHESFGGQIIFNQRGLEIQLHVEKVFDSNNEASLRFVSTNNNPTLIEDFNLAVAVIKVC